MVDYGKNAKNTWNRGWNFGKSAKHALLCLSRRGPGQSLHGRELNDFSTAWGVLRSGAEAAKLLKAGSKYMLLAILLLLSRGSLSAEFCVCF